MIQIKKTLLTLALLITAATGAWAQDVLNLVVSGTSATIKYDGNASNNPILGENGWEQDGDTWDGDYTTKPTITTVTIDGSCKNFSGPSLNALFAGFSGLTTINGLENLNTANVKDMSYMFYYCMSLTSLDLSSWNTERVTMMYYMFSDCSKLTTVDLSGWNTEHVEATSGLFYDCSNLENIYVGDGWSTAAVIFSDGMFYGCTKLLSMNTANPATDKTNAHTGDGGYLKVNPASGPKVAWDGEKKTGKFTMPGGNVTLEPDYYPQATAAEGAVTAADADAHATTDDPLVKVDATKLTGAKKLMYFVSNSGTTAPAYDAEGWTDQLPTAEGFTQQGIVYVWYYPVGTDEDVDEATATYSDGDICLQSITARIAAAPTYAVTLNAEGLSTDEAAAWKVAKGTDQPAAFPLEGVTKGTAVTVTYTGSKKVIGVKAEKKAAAPAETTVTLTTGEIGDLTSWGSNSKTINGITIAVSGDAHFFTTGYMEVSAYDGETGDPIPTTGTYTFTSSVGKIKRIDINHNSGKWWGSGDGWPGSYNVSHSSTFTWSGTPAASVTLYGSCNEDDQCAFDVSSFVFTIEPAN